MADVTAPEILEGIHYRWTTYKIPDIRTTQPIRMSGHIPIPIGCFWIMRFSSSPLDIAISNLEENL